MHPRTARAPLVLMLLALLALPLEAPAASSSSSCTTPEICAWVSLDQTVVTASLFDAASEVRVNFGGVVRIASERGHFVNLDLSVTGTSWTASVSPATITRQTDDTVPFTGYVVVPRSAAEGEYALTVRALDDDSVFPIDAKAALSLSVYRGPLALEVSLQSAPPRPGEAASWQMRLINLASYDIDFEPVFAAPEGFSLRSQLPATQIVRAHSDALATVAVTVPSTRPAGDYSWSVRVVSATYPDVSASLTVPFEVQAVVLRPPSGETDLLITYWFPISLGFFAVGIVLFVGFTEIGYLAAAFSLFVPLFTRLARDKILDNFTRGQIFGFIQANPGAHYSEVQRVIDVENGVLAYHLRVLLRENYLVARNEGIYKRFYPHDYKIPKRRTHLTRLQADILEQVQRAPGISQHDLASLLDESKQVVSYNIAVLREADMIRAERHGRDVLLFVAKEGHAPDSEPLELEPEEGLAPDRAMG